MIYIANIETKLYIKNINPNFETIIDNKQKKYLKLNDNNLLTLVNDSNELNIDFLNSDIAERINPKTKKCSVVKSIEGNSKNILKILDTTAGLGSDSFTLASRGHKIIALEKDLYIYLILQDGLNRALQDINISNIAKNITLINIDSNNFIKECDNFFDCIYIDPMFPERKKSAKVKKSMQILHKVAFNEDNSNKLILQNIIDKKITKKAIVKRPAKSEFLIDKKPSSQILGKANRFDIYAL